MKEQKKERKSGPVQRQQRRECSGAAVAPFFAIFIRVFKDGKMIGTKRDFRDPAAQRPPTILPPVAVGPENVAKKQEEEEKTRQLL